MSTLCVGLCIQGYVYYVYGVYVRPASVANLPLEWDRSLSAIVERDRRVRSSEMQLPLEHHHSSRTCTSANLKLEILSPSL